MANYNMVKGYNIKNETKPKEDKIVDTFRTLKLVREIEKKSHKLREIVDNVVLIGEDINYCCG